MSKNKQLQHEINQNDYREMIEQDIRQGVDEQLLGEHQLSDLYYYVSEHLRTYGYETEELPDKTLPPGRGMSTRIHGKRPQQKPHSDK